MPPARKPVDTGDTQPPADSPAPVGPDNVVSDNQVSDNRPDRRETEAHEAASREADEERWVDDPGPDTEPEPPEYYCPGCGRRFSFMTECRGRDEAPHPAILVVNTDELDGDPEDHTAAPPGGVG